MKKYTFLFLCQFAIICGHLSVSAQTLSNITLAYSCPCKVTATYTLNAAQPTTVQLYYSTDTVGYSSPGTTTGNWLPADTFPDRAPGTHTDFWDDCAAAGVIYGQFYFKLVPVSNLQCCEPTTVNIPMIFVEGGTFRLGAAVQAANDGQGDNGAETYNHDVTLSNFCLSETPVTQAQFTAVMGTNPSNFQGGVYAPSDDKPVEIVNWYDAITFCNKLSLMEGKTPVYNVVGIDWATLAYTSIPTSSNATWDTATMDLYANGYRLPTEAEWEYAARGGNQSLTALGTPPDFYYSGSNTANDVAWYSGNSGSQTHIVKQKQPNALGLYDMSGNVREWCWDWYAAYTNAPAENPTGPSTGSSRVIRGGGWYDNAFSARVSRRNNRDPNYRYTYHGFRLACSSE